MNFKRFISAAAAAVMTVSAFAAAASAATVEIKPVTSINLASLTGTGMVITGAASVAANELVLPGVQSDKGSTNPTGYITYTAPETGTLSLKFSGSAIKLGSNGKYQYPRLYCFVGVYSSLVTKNNMSISNTVNVDDDTNSYIAQVTAADTPVDVSIPVVGDQTYVLFGYLYNMTSPFTYTLTDFKFTPTAAVTVEEAEEYTPSETYVGTDEGVTATFTLSGGENTVTWYAWNASDTAIKVAEDTFTGEINGTAVFGLVITGGIPEGVSGIGAYVN